ncbi:spore coat protein GerQ [Paenibacillus sp. FSL M7-1455]|uniref:spore coat protein GerQ n=1 Tax=Paenibacillus sp. FSL M7-1455 TaxID=2975316 RepID=UPI004040C638
MVPQFFRPSSYQMGGYPGVSGSSTGMPGSMGTVPPQVTSGSPMTPTGAVIQAPQQQFEQSYVENILRLNLGKTGTFYMTYENNSQWNAKVFTGVIEAAGRDHIIISDRSTGQRILLLTLNLDYITFNEPLVYQYPGVIGNPPQGR